MSDLKDVANRLEALERRLVMILNSPSRSLLVHWSDVALLSETRLELSRLQRAALADAQLRVELRSVGA